MNICIIGKYPPIQGGVSRETYWLANGLAKRGHTVYVLTNAGEVEKRYRIFLDQEDYDVLEPKYPASSGRVSLKMLDAFSHLRASHIPLSRPFVSQLAGLAAETVRSNNCEVIFGYYFEPYGMAAHIAGGWTGKKYILKHAGSDFDRLMNVPALGESYRQAIMRAGAIITSAGLMPRFLRIGVSPEVLVPSLGFELPAQFNPNCEALDIGSQLARARDWLDYVPTAIREKDTPYDPHIPTIGVYGKVGETKGSYDLVRALSSLKNRGYRFNFLCMVNGMGFKHFADVIIESGLGEYTWILPFLPHWKVPGFIKACTAVCFLEREFPIAIHGPIIATEILSCGGCLIVSGEIARKQRHFLDLQPGKNALIVQDPRVTEELAGALEIVISDPDKARAIGEAAHTAFLTQPCHEKWIEAFEDVCHSLVAQKDRTHWSNSSSGLSAAPTLASLLPWTHRMQKVYPQYLPSLEVNGDGMSVEAACAYCNRTLDLLQASGSCPASIMSILRFERAVLSAAANAYRNGGPFVHADTMGDRLCTPEAIWAKRPEVNRHIVRYSFEYDIAECQHLFEQGTGDIEGIRQSPCCVLIYPRPNGAVAYSRLTPQLSSLLGACDGAQTVSDVIKHVAGENAPPGTAHTISRTLAQLHKEGIIIFC